MRPGRRARKDLHVRVAPASESAGGPRPPSRGGGGPRPWPRPLGLGLGPRLRVDLMLTRTGRLAASILSEARAGGPGPQPGLPAWALSNPVWPAGPAGWRQTRAAESSRALITADSNHRGCDGVPRLRVREQRPALTGRSTQA